ncbi:MAG: branched-chain amino acid ABC transporter permease [Chloroflexota bacterium]
MDTILLSVGFGLVTASILAIAAVGLSLQFGVTNFVNFAYGDYATFGAYMALLFNSHGLNIYLSMLLGGIFVGLFAVVVNRLIFRRFIDRKVKLLTLLIVTIGLSLFMQNAIQAIWGPAFQVYKAGVPNSLNIGPFILTNQQLAIIGIAVVCVLGVHAILRYTRMGKAMRAMSDNRDLAEVSGIDTNRVTDITWLLAGFLAGVAGVVFAINVSAFTPVLGSEFLFLIFAAVILGGIGRPYGAVLGALVIGISTEVAGLYIDSAYADAIAFLIMIVFLFVRPQGILASQGKV